MKRITLLVLLAVCAFAAVHSQNTTRQAPRNRQEVNQPSSSTSEKITVRGNLAVSQDMIAVRSGNTTFLVPELKKYSGSIDDLKDGVPVTIEGSALNNPDNIKVKTLIPTKMTLAGKEYDLTSLRSEQDHLNDTNPQRQEQRFIPPVGHYPLTPEPNTPQNRNR